MKKEAKSEALHKKMKEGEKDCAHCGKPKQHRIHHDEGHPKYHKFVNEDDDKEDGHDEEGKLEKKEGGTFDKA